MSERFDDLPCAQTCRRVDFDRVEILPGRVPGTLVLAVSGIAPWADLRVSLERLSFESAQDFAPFEVVGRLSGVALPAMIDFCVVLPISALEGQEGIEILGATRSERHILRRTVPEVAHQASPVRGK
ncbi:hypothetical protein BURK2_04034 [Burkholderiales bacterium]|nr:MAG: hypothetical protein F9K47_00975 [Burkholderiales bacterium]CAG1010427.1 hypothetical protein BURK2_04034 [Burkholderiales bacterium]